MLAIVDTAFSNERELFVCSLLLDISKGKRSSLQLIYNTHTAFLLCVYIYITIFTAGAPIVVISLL